MSTADQPVADYAPPTCACPTCGTVARRHSAYPRTVKDISLDGPVELQVRVGNYRCSPCGKFFKADCPIVGKGRLYSNRAIRKATVAVQQDKTTFTGLPNRLERDFNVSPVKSTGWKWFREFAGAIDVVDYLKWACSRFSGQLSVDSVSDGGVQTWFATDPLNDDTILGYHRDKHANAESLTAFLTILRDQYGVWPQLFIGDDAVVFDATPQKVWPGVPVQICHFHILKNINYNHLRHSLTARLKQYKPVKPPKNPNPDGTPLSKFSRGYFDAPYVYALRDYGIAQETWVDMHRRRRLFFKTEDSLRTPESVELKEAEALALWCEKYPACGVFRRFILDFYRLMACQDEASAELARRAFLAAWEAEAETDPKIGHVLKTFSNDAWFARLFPFTRFENAHRTTNSTERANRWFRKRQKTHYRNRREYTIKNMLHADLIYKRERTDPSVPPVKLKPKAIESRASA